MLTALTIKNYALIDDIHVDFSNGLSIITGETGAGKSILLGALTLILGKRADLSNIKDKSKKCIVEATFDVANYDLRDFFKTKDLDFEVNTILHREILPSGKSRAFVNDSPVNLSTLDLLGQKLIDIHSQHENLKLSDNEFQYQIIDALADNKELLNTYKTTLIELKDLQKEQDRLNQLKAEAIKEQDYNSFLLEELQRANLGSGDVNDLEAEQQKLSNVDFIKDQLNAAPCYNFKRNHWN